MNILVVIQHNINGCVYYRQLIPHTEMHANGEAGVTFIPQTGHLTTKQIKEYDIVQWHRGYMCLPEVRRIAGLGVKCIVDFDDYWQLPRDHILWNDYYFEKINGINVKRKETKSDYLISMLRTFEYVTVSTPILADMVRPFNKNVHVFENSINPKYNQWSRGQHPLNKIIFGWIGGGAHKSDIELLRGTPNKLAHDFETKDNYMIRLFGFTEGSVYEKYAEILSDDRKAPIQLFPPRPTLQKSWNEPSYTQYYNDLDVALVPLVDNKFNSSKSELKMVEAGFFKKPVIVSNVWPYKYIINDKNCKVVNKPGDWFKHMKFFIKNPSAVKEYGETLYESIKDKYDVRNVNKRRLEFYKEILN